MFSSQMSGEDAKIRLYRMLTFLAVIVGLFVAILAFNAIRESKYIGGNVPPQNVITINGTGEVSASPDIATIGFTVSETAKTVKGAQQLATEKMNAALAFIKKSNIADKDVRTDYYAVNPRYEYGVQSQLCTQTYCPPNGRQTLVGYEVSQQVTVTVRAIDTAGDILSGLGNVGVSNIQGPNFAIDKETELQREARKKAIDDAQTKANQLAKDLGVSIVRIISFSEGGNYPMFAKGMAYGMGGGDSATPAPAPQLPQGENKITSNVTIAYEIR